jgi:hypothetical protein
MCVYVYVYVYLYNYISQKNTHNPLPADSKQLVGGDPVRGRCEASLPKGCILDLDGPAERILPGSQLVMEV